MELLSGGGMASGPLSFMRGFDTSAGTIKSGGKTRRAAKMAILNIDHPDIEAFIKVKARQEGVARDLMSLGYDAGFDVAGGVYDIVSFQNTNHAVRVTDEFMSAVEHGDTWTTKAVKTGKPVKTYDARELLRMIAQATHDSGDPGMQFDTVTNRWNTVADTRRINASNPCSEYTFVDDSACNLASLNLMKFITPDGEFKIEAFRHAVAIAVLAQEILVDSGGYPTEMIAINSHMYRPLGLGYANLGALVMAKGYAYDSSQARTLAAEITALMTSQAYLTSAEIAARLGPFPKYKENRKSALRVLSDHGATAALKFGEFYTGIGGTAVRIFREALTLAEATGYRNAQVTLLAPCGTIGFMMDCATTGIEPELALVKYKTLVGGGTLTLINPLVGSALQSLGYSPADTEAIVNLLQNQGYAEGISLLKKEHLPVFDTSFPAGPSARAIHFMGHLKMMAAVQPFLSGAISKTVNMPKTATVDDIYNVFLEAWRMKLKCVAIYRDGSKGSQPLSTTLDAASDAKVPVSAQRKMVGDRKAVIHEFQLNGHKGFLTVGLYEDGTPGEVFVDISKEGSTVSGLMDSWSMLFSFCLQHGVPMEKLIKKLSHTKFDPSGWSAIPEIGYAHSLPDYIARWLELRFIRKAAASAPAPTADPASGSPIADGPMCPECGCQTVRSGTCHRCPNCGGTTGCS